MRHRIHSRYFMGRISKQWEDGFQSFKDVGMKERARAGAEVLFMLGGLRCMGREDMQHTKSFFSLQDS